MGFLNLKSQKKFLKLFLLIVLIQALFFCADRKRTNPLDPKNPETLGKPQNLRVYSESDNVFLSWNPVYLENLRGYRIYRKSGTESEFHSIKDVSADSSIFVDKNVTYYKRYTYRITILGEDFETEPGDTVSIIPGPTIIWAGDVYDRHIFKLSHDCSHEILHIPVAGYPWALFLEKSTNRLWLTDVLFNEVVRVDLATQSQVILERFYYGDPVDVVVDEKNNLVWAADEDSGVVHIYDRSGLKLKEIPDFQKISDIDCFFADGTCWVVDYKQNKLFSIRKNFQMADSKVEFTNPFRIAINQTTGAIWVLDDVRLLKLTQLGKMEFVVNFQFNNPYSLAVDSENGNCWVLDWYSGAGNSKILCFSETGQLLLEKSGFSYPENLVVNPDDHGCIIADTGNGRFVKLTSSGEIIGEMDGFFYPYGIAIEYER